MKKHFLFLLGLSFLFFSCKKSALPHGKTINAEETAKVELNNCWQKDYGSETISLCLKATEDSRCPSNAACVWQGLAKASFSFSINGRPHHFALATSKALNDSTEVQIENYKIALLNLLPYPNGTTLAKVAAEVRITRN